MSTLSQSGRNTDNKSYKQSVASRPLLWGALSLALSASFTAQAADDGLDEVVVVATRTAVSLDTVGNSVTVLNEQAIKDSQATIVSDLLATTAGITFARNGGPGTLTSVRIRGAESDQTVVLIDGVQMNDPSSPGGGFDFGNLLVGDIARIEILRGSQSTLYGSQAIGGVVNIVTKEAEGKTSGSVQTEIGSMQTGNTKASIGGKYDRISFRLAGGYYNTEGVSAYSLGQEKDPFRNTTFTGRFGVDVTDNVQLDLRALYTDGKYNYDGFPAPAFTFADEGDYGITRQFVGYGGVNFQLFDNRFQNRVAYQSTSTNRGTYLSTGTSVTRNGYYVGDNKRYEYQGTWKIADGYQAVFGAQHENTEMDSLSAPKHAEVDQDSFYAQVQAEVIKGLTLTGGERHDKHDTYGTHNTGQLAVAWALPSDTILRASWSQGFKAPTLYQLYSDYYNRDLKPEESTGWDTGVQQRLWNRRINLQLSYFSRDTKNQITYTNCNAAVPLCVTPGHSTFGYYANTAQTEATGVEFQATLRPLDALEVVANYTHMKAEDRSPGSTTLGKRLARRPDTTANLSVSYTWPIALKTTVAGRYSGESFDNASNLRKLDAYTLVDFRLAYELSEQVELFGRMENVFDEEYETVYQYGTVGRAGYAGVTVKF
ncbi:MAG: TonB-dependent receptor [Steroidobacteraceae bacterium]